MPQTENKTPERKTYTHKKPVFITLKPGEKILGIFLGSSIGKFKSRQYRIKRDGGELVVLAGSLRGRNFRAVFCRQKNGQRTLHLIEVKQAAHAATKGEG